MNIYGGLGLGIASPVAKVSAEPASSSGMSGVAYSSSSSEKKEADSSSSGGTSIALPGFSSDGTPHWEEHKVEPRNAEPGNTIDIALPGFDDNGTPHWEDHKLPIESAEPAQEKQLDVDKLLGYHNEGYKLYDDGEGGLTVDPNSKGGVYYGPGSTNSTAPKAKKQTATAALPEVSQIYTMDGDDYSFDTNAFAAAQRGTGEDQAAMSIAGSGSGGSKRNSNVNDAVFGGQSNKATPGYSLW